MAARFPVEMTGMDAVDRRALFEAVLEKNFLRYPSPFLPRAGWQKEWYHFCVVTPELDLIVNLNVSGDTRPAVRPGSRVARSVMLARTEGWHGDVETIDPRVVKAIPGEFGMTLGQNRVAFHDGRLELVASLHSQPLVADLHFEPETFPLGVDREVSVGRGSIGWFAIPRLAAQGRVIIGNRVIALDHAPAYHDHNWGRWLWGEDFAWEWGFVHFESGGDTWSVLFDRTLNRARTYVLEATVALWRGARLARLFSRDQIAIRPLIYRNPGAIFRVPPVLALAVPELGRDVPEQFEVTAGCGSDRVSFRLATEQEAQVLVPNETDLETTIITEVAGPVRIEGQVEGCDFQGSGRGLFEFLTT